MIDVVYPLKQFGSRWKDNELRYSLRSVEMHLQNYRDIYIIGYKPDFVKGVKHIEFADDVNAAPDNNILNKLLQICKIPGISEDFLFFNDDHYLLADFDAEKFPYYYCHTLTAYCQRRGADRYGLRAQATLKYLRENNLPDKHFDIHFPILYNKKKFLEIFEKVPKKENGYIIKSIYANSLSGLDLVETRDCKHPTAPPKKYICFSTMPKVSGALYRFFEFKFPKKSKFEI